MAKAVLEAFASQARACHKLGSPFTGWLCELLPELLSCETDLGRHILDWPGNPAVYADNLPLRLCGGLHGLALSQATPALNNLYRSFDMDDNARRIITNALITHADPLISALENPPQTNEVARAALVYPALMIVAERTGLAISLLEVGASASLNLHLDRFAYRLGGQEFGRADSGVRLEPDWTGPAPAGVEPQIANRRGCDLRPIDIANPAERLRLLSYVWADQPERMQRQRAAIDIALARPLNLDRTDAVLWLQDRLPQRNREMTTVVFSTVAWQYLPADRRKVGENVIRAAADDAHDGAPLAWIRFETDGNEPGAMLRLDLWPQGIHRVLARGDFHGRWVDWKG